MNSLSLKEHPDFGCVGNLKKKKKTNSTLLLLFLFLCLFRDAIDMLSALYNQVDEEVHKLVILSNKCQKELESLLEVRMFEEQTQQVSFSFCTVLLLLF